MPNAPPTSRDTTRSLSTGTFIVRATSWRIAKALCDATCKYVAVGFGFVDGDAGARLHRRHDDALIDEPHSCDVGCAGEEAVEFGAVLGFRAIGVPADRDIARR